MVEINKENLEKMAKKIVKAAKELGVERNFYFLTTFQRYQFQLKLLDELEAEINENGTIVEKEYVKGRRNMYTNPAIDSYNKTCNSANQTLTALLKIISELKEIKEKSVKSDPLLEALNVK